MGLAGRTEEEAMGTARCTSMLSFPCRRSSKMNPSISYIKKSDIFLKRGMFGSLQLGTQTSNKLRLHGIVISQFYLIEFTLIATVALTP